MSLPENTHSHRTVGLGTGNYWITHGHEFKGVTHSHHGHEPRLGRGIKGVRAVTDPVILARVAAILRYSRPPP